MIAILNLYFLKQLSCLLFFVLMNENNDLKQKNQKKLLSILGLLLLARVLKIYQPQITLKDL